MEEYVSYNIQNLRVVLNSHQAADTCIIFDRHLQVHFWEGAKERNDALENSQCRMSDNTTLRQKPLGFRSQRFTK